MPEALVLLVNAFRGPAALIAFCVRNFIPLVMAAGAGWLGWRFGWQAPALVVALVLAGLLGWFLADRDTFVRWVARPVRARWRLSVVYRRDWQPVMVMAGLSKVHKRREYLPSIIKVRCGPTSDRVLVKMLKGQAPSAWEQVTDNLAHGFGAQLCRARKADRPGRVWLELVRKDALETGEVPARTHPAPARWDRRATATGCAVGCGPRAGAARGRGWPAGKSGLLRSRRRDCANPTARTRSFIRASPCASRSWIARWSGSFSDPNNARPTGWARLRGLPLSR